MRAFRQAVAILQSHRNPLVVFPEGDVYHTNERITPFREGPAAMALLAARKRARKIVCIPCGIKYRYLEDPTPELLRTMDDLERAILWRPRPDLALEKRIYHFAEGVLALKEIEFLGHTCSGPVRKRVADLIEFILGPIEARYGLDTSEATVPERVKLIFRYLAMFATGARWRAERLAFRLGVGGGDGRGVARALRGPIAATGLAALRWVEAVARCVPNSCG